MTAAAAPPAQINTANLAGRRSLRFSSIDEVLADVDHLVQAERAGKLRRIGNWTLGQTLGHLACWAEYAYTGSPLKPPWFIRAILRMRKQKFLYGPMRAGVRIPGVDGGTLNTEVMSTEEAHQRYRRALEHLKSECPPGRHAFLGDLSHKDWIALNLRHAELHLSFMKAE